MLRSASAACLLLGSALAAAQDRGWLGAQLQSTAIPADLRPLADGATAGIVLAAVVPGGPADRSGFRQGDVLVAIDGRLLLGSPADELNAFAARLGSLRPGDELDVVLLRDVVHYEARRDGAEVADPAGLLEGLADEMERAEPGTRIDLSAWKQTERLELHAVLGQRPTMSERELPPTAELLPFAAGLKPTKLEKEIERRIAKSGLEDAYADLRERLSRLARSGDRSRLFAVALVHREPHLLPDLAERFAGAIEAGGEEGGPRPGAPWLRAGAEMTDCLAEFGEVSDDSPEELPVPKGSLPEILEWIEATLGEANGLRGRALEGLASGQAEHVGAHWRELGQRFEEHVYLYTDEDAGRLARNEDTLRAGEAVRRGFMLRAARHASRLAGAELVESLSSAAQAEGLDLSQGVIAERDTPHGRILVAGTGNDWHRSGELAVLIDLGGDDFYSNNVAATVGQAERPVIGVSVFVDADGDDAYEATHAGAMGFGLLGVGILVDRAGDDSYVGLRWTQGAGYMGVGLLVDLAGNDRYRCHALSQGVGLWGFGMLADLEGDDRYEGHRFAQAVGMAGGAGVLYDREGADEYWCKGTYPTGYGTEGVWEGWGQGCGVGFRGNASGGLALLVDGAGQDRYEAGNFSQGGGYYYGLGALFDRGRADDVYVGSRYDQGFSAHQAIGYFHEEGGDDVYATRNAVAHGLAWDESVTVFIDDAGSDVYEGGGFSLGASAHNAIAVFWDRKGKDTYLWDDLGRAGPNDYHGGTSLSFFLDEGGAEDIYRDGSRNDSERTGGEHGFFVDR